ncbi:hypothetical protein HQ535_12220 [bacterium]|nr:hypothetical protein [bacterium]
MGFTGEVFDEGLPSDPVAHRGVQVWLLGEGLVLDPFDAADPIQAAKVLGASLWFALLVLTWHVARDALGAPQRYAWAAVAGAALFAPINLPLTELSRSSYRGLINASGSMYHNYPQLIVVVLGAAAVAAVGVAAKGPQRRRPALVSASVFASASFWFKPSLYLALGPALACVAVVLLYRKWRDLGLVAAVLGLPLAYWVAYPRIVGPPPGD